MTSAHAGDAPYRVPRENRRWPSLALATAMHAGLLFFLWVGVHWQSSEPVAVEAEVWDMKTQAAAPPPAPAPEPTPTPVERPAPRPTPAEAVETPLAPKAPDIALERLKAKLKAEKQKLAEEVKRNALHKQEEQEKADKAAKLAKEKAKADAKAQALADAKAEKELAEKKELADKKLTDKKLADKLAKSKQAAEDQKAADKLRDAEMRRITGATGSGTSGTAAKSTAPRMDSGYLAAITSKIKNNIAYSGSTDVPDNPRAVFKIEQLPTGEIISVRKIKSSGIPAYDNAVENAIAKSSPLPKKKDGTVVRDFEAVFNMKDLP